MDMRHLVGVGLAIAWAAVVFFAASWGYVKLLIAVPRISPLAAGLPGLALLAWSVWYLVSVRHAVQYIPLKTRAYGAGFEAMLFDGVLALAGAAMIIPLFIPSRWRSRRAVPEPVPYAGTTAPFPDLQATQTMQADNGLL